MTASSGVLLLLLLSTTCWQHYALCSTAAVPPVKLRVATIDPLNPPSLSRGRNALALDHPPLNHPAWGHLQTRQQHLLTFSPNATHEERVGVVEQLQQLGGIVSGVIPEDSMVMLMTPAVADAAAASEHVVWMV